MIVPIVGPSHTIFSTVTRWRAGGLWTDSLVDSPIAAGADLKDIAGLDAAGARACRYLEDLCDGMGAVRKPLLAAVNGPAVSPTLREAHRGLVFHQTQGLQ